MRALTVVDAGPLTTVQDRGRTGWAHLGVPRAGALDPPAAGLGNRLVGNEPGAALLETTAGGVVLTAHGRLTLAVTGAPCAVSVAGRAMPLAEPFAVRRGETVVVGAAVAGLRSYVAVSGGLDVAPVLGSRSTDTLGLVGPPPLRDGDVLPVGEPTGLPAGTDLGPLREPPRPARLRVLAGPRLDWFDGGVLDALTSSPYTVTADSNRVGLRLDGPVLRRTRAEELPSEGLVLGAVQVPASGQPLVFLADHPTTGGYPVVALVDPRDLWQCAQLRPGEQARFSRP